MGDLSHDDTDEDAEEDGAHVGVVEVFDLCADHIFEALNVFSVPVTKMRSPTCKRRSRAAKRSMPWRVTRVTLTL